MGMVKRMKRRIPFDYTTMTMTKRIKSVRCEICYQIDHFSRNCKNGSFNWGNLYGNSLFKIFELNRIPMYCLNYNKCILNGQIVIHVLYTLFNIIYLFDTKRFVKEYHNYLNLFFTLY